MVDLTAMEEEPNEHQLSVTQEFLQILEDFAIYIDVFLFEIVTFLAVINSFMNLLADVLKLWGLSGWAVTIFPSSSFLVSITLFIFGTRKRSNKRKENLDKALNMFDDVIEVVDDVRDINDEPNEYSSAVENSSLLSQGISVDIDPIEISIDQDEINDKQVQDASEEDPKGGVFGSAVGCTINIARTFQNEDHTVKHPQTFTNDNKITRKNVKKEAQVYTPSSQFIESPYTAEEASQGLASGVTLVGHGLQRDADFISGRLKQKGTTADQLSKRKRKRVREDSKKVLEKGKDVSSLVQNKAKFIGKGLSYTNEDGVWKDKEKLLRFVDENLESDHLEEDADLSNCDISAMGHIPDLPGTDRLQQSALVCSKGVTKHLDKVPGHQQINKKIPKKAIIGVSSKAKNIYAKRKKGLKKEGRKRPKSLLQIYARLGRLILRVLRRRKSSPDQEPDKVTGSINPGEEDGAKGMTKKISRFFVHYRTRRNKKLATLPRLRIVKSFENTSESNYVVCSEDFLSHKEDATKTLLEPTEENSLSEKSIAEEEQEELLSPVFNIPDKTLTSFKNNVDKWEQQHSGGTTLFNFNIHDNMLYNTSATNDTVIDVVDLNNNDRSINDLESSVVLHCFSDQEHPHLNEDRPYLEKDHLVQIGDHSVSIGDNSIQVEDQLVPFKEQQFKVSDHLIRINDCLLNDDAFGKCEKECSGQDSLYEKSPLQPINDALVQHNCSDWEESSSVLISDQTGTSCTSLAILDELCEF